MSHPARQLLPADAVSRATALGLFARRIVEGASVGENRSPYHGFSVEFSQHRQYAPGDDLRHIDWKVLARTDRFFVKRYQQETNCGVQILIDASASMAYGEGDENKLEYARRLAACVAYVSLMQRDSVRLHAFDEKLATPLPRRSSLAGIHDLLLMLAGLEARGGTQLPAALAKVVATTSRRGIVVIISDLLDDEEQIIAGLRRATVSGQEVVVFHVMHHDELAFDFRDAVRFSGLEEQLELSITPRDVRKSYLEALEEFRRRVRHGCEGAKSHYVLFDTRRPLAEALGEYLMFRKRGGMR